MPQRGHDAALAERGLEADRTGQLGREGHHAKRPVGTLEDALAFAWVEVADARLRLGAGRARRDPGPFEVEAERGRAVARLGRTRLRERAHAREQLGLRPRDGGGQEAGDAGREERARRLAHGESRIRRPAQHQRPVVVHVEEAWRDAEPAEIDPLGAGGRRSRREAQGDAAVLDEESAGRRRFGLGVEQERVHERDPRHGRAVYQQAPLQAERAVSRRRTESRPQVPCTFSSDREGRPIQPA